MWLKIGSFNGYIHNKHPDGSLMFEVPGGAVSHRHYFRQAIIYYYPDDMPESDKNPFNRTGR